MFELLNILAYSVLILLLFLMFFPPGVSAKQPPDREWVQLMTYVVASFMCCYFLAVGIWFSVASLCSSAYAVFMKIFY